MLNTIITWIATKVLEWLLRLVKTSVEEYLAELAEQRKRGEINEANVKAYEEAKSRQGRIEEALRLLDRSAR